MTTFGTPRRHVAQCGSTNDLAREWARDPDDPAPSGALVTADFQTRGRGQRGRQWQAGWGQSALMSFVYRLPPTVEAGQLGLVVALAVSDALASTADLTPRLKWPNDILLDDRKVAGILVEISPPAPPTVSGGGGKEQETEQEGGWTRKGGGTPPLLPAPVGVGSPDPLSPPAPPELGVLLGWAGGRSSQALGLAILGIGVNVNQERFVGAEGYVYPPTSLRLVTGTPYEVEGVIAAVALALTEREGEWRRDGFAPVLEDCRKRLAVGATVRRGELRGELVGLAPTGAVQVRLPGGTFAEWHTVD